MIHGRQQYQIMTKEYHSGVSKTWSSFVAGLLVGVAVTAGLAAVVVRINQLSQPTSQTEILAAGSRQLRLAHGLPLDHPIHLGLTRFAEIVEQESDGRLRIQVFPNTELGSTTETLEQVQSGTLDFAQAAAAAVDSFAPDLEVFSVPYAFRDQSHYHRILDGPIGEEILGSLSERGLKGLCFLDAGARSFYTTRAPVLEPSDLVGKKIRVMESPAAMNMVSAFGGSPTPMAFAELYSALQSGLVDGAENNPPSYLSSRHYEVAPYYTLNEHSRVPDVLVASRAMWEGLSRSDQVIIMEAARDAAQFQRNLWADRSAEALRELESRGVAVHRVDPMDFAGQLGGLQESYAGTRTGELLKMIRDFDSESAP